MKNKTKKFKHNKKSFLKKQQKNCFYDKQKRALKNRIRFQQKTVWGEKNVDKTQLEILKIKK